MTKNRTVHGGKTDDRYVIRPFVAEDSDAFLELHSDIFGGNPSNSWLDWKYTSNPYFDGTPIIVTERDGELVGARPFFALRMRAGDEDVLALQPADAMVHPDHRRRGLFTRMTRAAIDSHRTGKPAFYFNFPNPKSLPGNLDLGWDRVGELPTYYRIQKPGVLLRSRMGRLGGFVASLLDGAAGTYHSVHDRVATLQDNIEVQYYQSVPAATLAALADDAQPSGLHAIRAESFYRWRFEDAPTTYLTYVAERGDEPLCALVVAEGTYGGEPVRRVVDVAPVGFEAEGEGRHDALRSALVAVLEDSGKCAAVVAPAMTLPDAVMASLGFYRRTTPVLSRLTESTPFVVRSLDVGDGSPSQTVNGIDLVDEESWSITFAEHDNR